MLVYYYTLYVVILKKTTTVKVSKDTLAMLERLRDKLQAKSVDETIQLLLVKHRVGLIDEMFGVDRGLVKSFTEEDRGEDRS